MKKVLPGICILGILISLSSCETHSDQQAQAAEQHPRYEVLPRLLVSPQRHVYHVFEGHSLKQRDTIQMELESLGEGRFRQYEIHNVFREADGSREVAMMETIIDIGDSLTRQPVRDQRFRVTDTSVTLTRFDASELSLQEVYELPASDSLYQVYNFYGFAHQGDITPSHRIFWTQQFGTFFSWYGEDRTMELVEVDPPIAPSALLALRNAIRDLLNLQPVAESETE